MPTTRYWDDLRRDITASGYVLCISGHGPGMEWIDKAGNALAVQDWSEAPREFHWRAIRLLDAEKRPNAPEPGDRQED